MRPLLTFISVILAISNREFCDGNRESPQFIRELTRKVVEVHKSSLSVVLHERPKTKT